MVTEVYNTLSFNDCPENDWYALDAQDLKNQLGAVYVSLNGPRHWTVNGAENNTTNTYGKIASFGNLQMLLSAQIEGTIAENQYTENIIKRWNTWIFNAGNEVYKLVNPQGEEYIMQSYSKKINADQSIDDLAALGAVLNLPAGWSFETEVLVEELRLSAGGEAIVIQDDFQNTYQKR